MPYLDPAAGANRETRSGSTAPVAGTNAVQTLTRSGTPTTGGFKLQFEGFRTAQIAYNAAAAAVASALEALPNIGTGGVVGGGGPLGTAGVTVTFSGGTVQRRPVGLLTVVDNTMDGSGAIAVANTTPGVAGSGRGAPLGATYIDTATGIRYVNRGTVYAPNWVAE